MIQAPYYGEIDGFGRINYSFVKLFKHPHFGHYPWEDELKEDFEELCDML